jgi:hypothetical protein
MADPTLATSSSLPATWWLYPSGSPEEPAAVVRVHTGVYDEISVADGRPHTKRTAYLKDAIASDPVLYPVDEIIDSLVRISDDEFTALVSGGQLVQLDAHI